MISKVLNIEGRPVSIQVSYLQLVTSDFTSNVPFLVKVLEDDTITAKIKLIDTEDYVETVLYPGWNPELCLGIKDASGQIQIGR